MTTGQNMPPPAPVPQPSLPSTEPASTRQKFDRTQVLVAAIGAAGVILAAVISAANGWLHYTGPGSTPPPAQAASRPASPPANPPQSSTNPTPATSPQSPATTSGTVYLASMNSLVASGSDTPKIHQWIMQGTAYPNSLGYDGTSSVESVQYDLKGTHCSWFDATVGINDAANVLNQNEQFGFTVTMNPGNRQYTYNASVGQPTPIRLALHGATVIALQTDTSGGSNFSLFPGSVALWGSARLTP
jgi:hypothetical protein